MENFTVKKVFNGTKSGDTIVREIYHKNELVGEVLIDGYFGKIWAVDVKLWSGNNCNDKRCYFYPNKLNTTEQQIEECVIGIQKQIKENIINDVYTEKDRKQKANFEKITRPEPLKEINFDKLKNACAEYLRFIDKGEVAGDMRHTIERQERYKVFGIAIKTIYGDSIEGYINKQGYDF